jgi:hypothetical protein
MNLFDEHFSPTKKLIFLAKKKFKGLKAKLAFIRHQFCFIGLSLALEGVKKKKKEF